MKKYLLYALGLIAVACVALLGFDALCVALVKQSQGTTMYKMYRLFVDHPADEIPIFGSSRAASNYVPSMISPKAFCYGIDGSGMNETLFLLENYLHENPKGGPIIVNLDPWGFPKSHEGGFVSDYTLSPIAPEPQCSVPGIRMIGKLRGVIASWLNQRTANTKRIDSGAILQLVNRTPQEWDFIESKIDDWGFNIDDEWRNRVMDLSKLSDRTIVWVVGPCLQRWREKFSGREPLVQWLATLRTIPRFAVVDLYDMECTRSISLDDKHLNAKGAETFSRRLVNELGMVNE